MSNLVESRIEGFHIRLADENDVGLILQFIKELAAYEKLSNEVVATEEILRESLFILDGAKVIIGEYLGKPVGFALYFYSFSTFLGRKGIFLEDLFVKPEMRGKGFGKLMLSYLAKIAMDNNYGRLEWNVLDWNEPSIKFYESLEAKPLNEWITYRLTGDTLKNLADNF